MFAIWAFLLLGIERFLYGYIYHFPESFKGICKGPLSDLLKYDDGRFWEVAKHLGVVIKVFQFGVVGYDLVFRVGFNLNSPVAILAGLVLACLGQVLNAAVFNAIGAMGVYYGNELGYQVPWCTGFPYNLPMNDPQYWGVIMCIWGIYLVLSPSPNVFGEWYVVPWLETFWYIVSMKLLEHRKNGSAMLRSLGVKGQAK